MSGQKPGERIAFVTHGLEQFASLACNRSFSTAFQNFKNRVILFILYIDIYRKRLVIRFLIEFGTFGEFSKLENTLKTFLKNVPSR